MDQADVEEARAIAAHPEIGRDELLEAAGRGDVPIAINGPTMVTNTRDLQRFGVAVEGAVGRGFLLAADDALIVAWLAMAPDTYRAYSAARTVRGLGFSIRGMGAAGDMPLGGS